MASCSNSRSRERGVTLLEVLAASIIIFIVLAAALVAYFLSIYQSVREIVDTEVKAISRSVEQSIRAAARATLAVDKRSFYADVEGVRIFIPLPQPGQPAVDLPDYNEDIDGNGVWSAADIDWDQIDSDQDGVRDIEDLNAPAYAKPELTLDINPADGTPDNIDGIDQDADGAFDQLDGPNSPEGRPESFLPDGAPTALGTRSQAYNGNDDDNDDIYDDRALWMYPVGLLATVDSGNYKEYNNGLAFIPPPAFSNFGYAGAGWGNWAFQPTLGEIPMVLPPVDEDLNHDRATSTRWDPTLPPAEAALVRNQVPGISIAAEGWIAFFPDTFEDLNGDGRIAVAPNPGSALFDINNNNPGLAGEYIEYAEDFNLNGFLDVPIAGSYPGSAYFHSYFGPGVPPAFPADPLSQGLVQVAPPVIQPAGAAFEPSAIPEPYQTANFVYSNQLQSSRNFGYTIRVQRVEEPGAASQGFGGTSRSVYRFTLTFYFDYAASLQIFRQGGIPDAVRVQSFEVIVE